MEALRTKAAEQGLTLEAWLQELAQKSMSSTRRGRYRLADLIAGFDPGVPRTEEDRAWLNDAPVGNEGM